MGEYRIGCGMNEHNRSPQHTGFVETLTEYKVIVMTESHAAKYDNLRIGLHSDSCQHVIVGFTGN